MARSEFDDVYHRYYNHVLRFAERRVDAETARDVAAECFAIAWRKFDPAEPPELPWLYQVARNVLGNAYRRRARDLKLLDALRHAQAGEATAPDGIRSAMELLGVREREALELTYWEGLGAADVAKVLGCSEQAAWKLISRGRQRLRRILEPTRTSDEQIASSGQEEDSHV